MVNDGSTDDTEVLVEGWLVEGKSILVRLTPAR